MVLGIYIPKYICIDAYATDTMTTAESAIVLRDYNISSYVHVMYCLDRKQSNLCLVHK